MAWGMLALFGVILSTRQQLYLSGLTKWQHYEQLMNKILKVNCFLYREFSQLNKRTLKLDIAVESINPRLGSSAK